MMRGTARHAAIALAALLVLPAYASAQHQSHQENQAMKNIVQVAVDAGTFKTLVSALQVAGLVDALEGEGPFTVFAPNDAAFARLPAGTVDGLLRDKARLTSVLTFHVVPGRLLARDILASDVTHVRTLNGDTLDVRVRDGKVYVNGGAQVVTADIVASNGVIHVIDDVLLPAAAPARR